MPAQENIPGAEGEVYPKTMIDIKPRPHTAYWGDTIGVHALSYRQTGSTLATLVSRNSVWYMGKLTDSVEPGLEVKKVAQLSSCTEHMCYPKSFSYL